MITLRPYQQEAVDAVFDYWKDGGGNPLIELATGLGKSVVLAEICKRVIAQYPTMRIIMATHVAELVEQNYRALHNVWPEAPAGIYSAGLNRRDYHHRIIFGSIQSIYRKIQALEPRHLVIVDEAHLIPSKGEGMYRKFLEGLRDQYEKLRVLGLTATPYRLDSGHLCGGKNPMFDDIVYEYGIGQGTEDGWLSPLVSQSGSVDLNVDGVQKRGGDFIPSQLNMAMAQSGITEKAIADIMARGRERKKWLLFCPGIDHAGQCSQLLNNAGISTACVSGNTPKAERKRIIDQFRHGHLRAITNCSVLTTGFDAPDLDLYNLKEARGGYECVATWRESNTGRPVHERKRNLSIQRNGIKDWGTDQTYSAIDLVMAAKGLNEVKAFNWFAEHLEWQTEFPLDMAPRQEEPIEEADPEPAPEPMDFQSIPDDLIYCGALYRIWWSG